MTEHDLDDWYEENDYHRLGITKKQLDNLRAWQSGAQDAKRKKMGSTTRRDKGEDHGQRDFQFDGETEGNHRS